MAVPHTIEFGDFMRKKPSLADLLDIAHETISKKLTPNLTGEARYNALMVGNAISIVKRQIISQEQNFSDDFAELFELLDANDAEQFYCQLAKEIRAGLHEPGISTFKLVQESLLKSVKASVAESNPNYFHRDKKESIR